MEDISLFEKVKEGNAHAFKTIFNKYFLSLCRYSNRLINSELVAEEIASTIFIRIWKKRTQINIEYDLSKYLYRSVHNQSINYLKKKRVCFVDSADFHEEIFGSWNNSEEELSLKELEDKVETLIQSMPTQRQKIFRMSKIECMRYAEIADILSISIFTVQNHMSAANKYISGFYNQFQN